MQHYTELMEPERDVSFLITKYDKFGMSPVLDKDGKEQQIEIVLNKPTLDDDDALAEVIKAKRNNKDYFREAVRLLIPRVKKKMPAVLAVDSLIMQTGGYQREDSLSQRALALFGRNDPERIKLLQAVLAKELATQEEVEDVAGNPAKEKAEAELEDQGLNAHDPPS